MLGTVVDADGLVTNGTGGYDGANVDETTYIEISEVGSVILQFSTPTNASNPTTMRLDGTVTATSTNTFVNGTPDLDPAVATDVSNRLAYQWYIGDPNGGGVAIEAADANYDNENSPILNIVSVLGLGGTEFFLVVTHLDNLCIEEIRSGVLVVDCVDRDDTDGDGLTDCEEISGIDDPTRPLNPVDFGVTPDAPSDPLDPCNPGTGEIDLTNTIWAAADCDGDGVANADEVDPDGDGIVNTDGTETDWNDPCDYDPASQIVADVSAEWEALDCDADGITNGQEVIDGTNPLDPASDVPVAEDDTIIGIAQDTPATTIDVLADNGNGADTFGSDGPNDGAITLSSGCLLYTSPSPRDRG